MTEYARAGEVCGAGFDGEPHRFTGDTSDGIARCVLCAKRWTPIAETAPITEDLDAMVKAMLEELHRQAQGEGTAKRGPYVDDGSTFHLEGGEFQMDDGPDFENVLIDGRVDLKKIALAGLQAVKP